MRAKDFLKISKTEITILIDIVAITGFLSVPGSFQHFSLLIPLIAAGSLGSMAASILNNVYDRDVDPIMKRTESRQEVINGSNYWKMAGLSGAMMFASSVISYFMINALTMLFIWGGFLSYVVLYTIFLKRRTTWNIVIGGIAGSFPALAGWSTLTGSVSFTSLFIAFVVFLWTPTHFWSLATGNVEDYKKANIPMLPAIVGVKKGAFWILVNTAVLVAYSALPIFFSQIHVGLAYYFVAFSMDVVLVYYVVRPFFNDFSMKDFRKAFHFSNLYLLILLLSMWVVNLSL